jgi:hypothetical protein
VVYHSLKTECYYAKNWDREKHSIFLKFVGFNFFDNNSLRIMLIIRNGEKPLDSMALKLGGGKAICGRFHQHYISVFALISLRQTKV